MDQIRDSLSTVTGRDESLLNFALQSTVGKCHATPLSYENVLVMECFCRCANICHFCTAVAGQNCGCGHQFRTMQNSGKQRVLATVYRKLSVSASRHNSYSKA
ncbi:hypothetical protein BaRGS_00030103 [Batillaria attramentaria]|uniref:Uncharacterized protein n=1 Tax=Batillaria attramentaria TaxID=370345 RepID=A0ABD0JU70_9CAEN